MMPMRRYHQSWLPAMFDDFFDNDWMKKANATAPAINVIETDTEYKVEVAAPGMNKEDFNVHVDENGNLVIAMEKKCCCKDKDECKDKEECKEKEKKSRYLRREFSYTKFQQTLILPEDVVKDTIKASMNDGVLSIELPRKSPDSKNNITKVIEIK
jgi:HSP20 family protein